jgi:lambda repressor-like predicted transcriptional regulator
MTVGMSRKGQQSVAINVELLQASLVARGVSMARFAKVAGVHENTVQNVMRSGRAGVETLEQFTLALELLPRNSVETLMVPAIKARKGATVTGGDDRHEP